MDDAPTCLLTVTGKDRPGLTATLASALGDAAVDILDVEQVVVRGRLLLGILVTAPADIAAFDRFKAEATALGLAVDVESTTGDPHRRRPGRSHVTVLGLPLIPSALAGVTAAIASVDANIDRIRRVARYPVTAVELEVSGLAPEVLRTHLALVAVEHDIDIAVQASGLHRRGKRLIVMDVDSTLVQGEVVEMLAARAGCEAEVAAITDRAMRGELDFEQSLRARVEMLKGLPESVLDEVRAGIQLMPGARTLVRTLRRLGYRTAIVSGGFAQITEPLAAELGINHARANVLEIRDGLLTGGIVGDVVDRQAKAEFLRSVAALENVPLSSTVAIGDGANDLDMIDAAGLGVAFNAKPVLRDAADTSLSTPYLDSILYLLGITREEIEAADAEQGMTTPAPPVR